MLIYVRNDCVFGFGKMQNCSCVCRKCCAVLLPVLLSMTSSIVAPITCHLAPTVMAYATFLASLADPFVRSTKNWLQFVTQPSHSSPLNIHELPR